MMQTNNQQSPVTDMMSGFLFCFARAYVLLVLQTGAFTLLVFSWLFRNIVGVLALLMIALTLFLYFK
jgi:hypothetical protein